MEDRMLTIQEAAEIAQCGENNIRRAINLHKLPATRLHKNALQIKLSDLEAWIDEPQNHKSGPKPKHKS